MALTATSFRLSDNALADLDAIVALLDENSRRLHADDRSVLPEPVPTTRTMALGAALRAYRDLLERELRG
jgi:hypothetical protein